MTTDLNYSKILDDLQKESHFYAKQEGFLSNTNHNDKVDAFRHIFSSALLTIENGKYIQQFFGNMHELLTQNPTDEKIMDYYNDEIGREIGENINNNKNSLNFKNKDELKRYIAYEVSETIKSNKVITNLSDKRIKQIMKNIPDNPLRIYTREEIDKMSTSEFSKNEKNIFKQLKNYGIPKTIEAEERIKRGDLIYVNSYTRDDGTEVSGYYRRK